MRNEKVTTLCGGWNKCSSLVIKGKVLYCSSYIISEFFRTYSGQRNNFFLRFAMPWERKTIITIVFPQGFIELASVDNLLKSWVYEVLLKSKLTSEKDQVTWAVGDCETHVWIHILYVYIYMCVCVSSFTIEKSLQLW